MRSANRPANWAPPTEWRQTPETGGGIHVTDGGRLTARHSTVTRSIANANGGGIYSTGVLTVEHTTVSRNTANSSSDVPAEGRRDPPARRRNPSRTAPCPTGGRGTRGHRGIRGNRWPLTDRSRRNPRVRRPGGLLCHPVGDREAFASRLMAWERERRHHQRQANAEANPAHDHR